MFLSRLYFTLTLAHGFPYFNFQTTTRPFQTTTRSRTSVQRIEPAVTVSDEVVTDKLSELGYLTNYMTITEEISFTDTLLKRNAMIERPIDEPVLTFDRSFIVRNLKDDKTVLNYLDAFGFIDAVLQKNNLDYMDNAVGNEIRSPINAMGNEMRSRINVTDLHEALTLFQKFNGLASTGVVTFDNLKIMQLPRCGVPDTFPNYFSEFHERVETFNDNGIVLDKRYDVSKQKWKRRNVTFHINSSSKVLRYVDTRKELIRAFKVWTRDTPLNIIEAKNARNADIIISFEKSNHGDNYPFDGSLGVLAHAFYPRNGEVHFDDDEEFTIKSTKGIDLYTTAVHEFGHSFGLMHSRNRNSVMSPYHPGLQKKLILKNDDIAGITMLYGKGHGGVFEMDAEGGNRFALTPEEQRAEKSNLIAQNPKDGNINLKIEGRCMDTVDGALMSPDKKCVYLFSKDMYYKLHQDSLGIPILAEGYPKTIALGWGGVPDNIDSAFSSASTQTAYFFKGNQYWRYDFEASALFPGYPRTIPTRLPQQLEAVVKIDNVTYFFGKQKAWKHISGSVDGRLLKVNKKPLLDAAFPSFINGYIVTIKGQRYSVYESETLTPVLAYNNRPISWDFGITACKNGKDEKPKPGKQITKPGKKITKRMVTMCRALGMLAGQDHDIHIPSICYVIGKKFAVKQLEPIYT